MTDHDDLEQRVRASLDTHAGEVDTTVPVAARASAAARRHRGRWVAAGAAVAVAAVAVVAVVVDRPDPPPASEPPVTSTPLSPSDPSTAAGWRTEYWHDVSVEVPADWAWGAGPTGKGQYRCGGPDDRTTPYVGRPVMLSDLCVNEVEPAPEAPYVWFDAKVDPGTVELPHGYVQETVEVVGTTVTVGSDDDALRDRILSSVVAQDLCPSTVPADGPDVGGMPTEGVGDVRTFTMCAYTRSELVYGADLGVDAYARWQRALPDDPGGDVTTGCPSHDEQVVLTGTFDDPFGTEPIPLTWVVDVACNMEYSAYGDAVITPAMKDVWLRPALRSILRTYIGILG